MTSRWLTPIWVRVSGIITLILAGIVVSSMLLGSAISRGDHDDGRQMPGMGQHGIGGGSATPMPSHGTGQHTGSDGPQSH